MCFAARGQAFPTPGENCAFAGRNRDLERLSEHLFAARRFGASGWAPSAELAEGSAAVACCTFSTAQPELRLDGIPREPELCRNPRGDPYSLRDQNQCFAFPLGVRLVSSTLPSPGQPRVRLPRTLSGALAARLTLNAVYVFACPPSSHSTSQARLLLASSLFKYL